MTSQKENKIQTKKSRRSLFNYIAPDRLEKDPGFHDYLARLSRSGMVVAGILAVIAILFFICVNTFVIGKSLSWTYQIDDPSSVAVGDKALIFFLGVISIVLSRTRLGPQWGRTVVFLLILIACVAVVWDDIARGDVSLSAGYLTLVMLIGVGSMPFRPWQVSLLGTIITLSFYFSLRYLPSSIGIEVVLYEAESFVLLAMATLLCTVITGLIYHSRYRLYRARQKQIELRQSVTKYAEDLKEAYDKLHQTQAQLVQSEKMASLGNLVAGIAHEINTPLGALNSMHDTLFRTVGKIKKIIDSKFPKFVEEQPEIKTTFKIIDDSNKVITSGTERVINIVSRLRSFARLDEAELKTVDIHEGLEDTLVLIHHGIKENITVVKNFGKIPPIACFPGQLNQVFLNLLINSKQAVKDKGTITITTCVKNKKAHISFSDDGIGIPKEKIDKVFDPGYTTKGSGVGTGLGLSISYNIIQNHKGEIKVESELGKGATFTIILPMNLNDKAFP